VASYTYNGRNQLHQTKVEDGNLFTATRAYDDAGRLTAVGTASPSSPILDSTAYQLSPDGRRTGIARNGQSETYGYDPARQIESASIPLSSGTRTNAYQYDAAANRRSTTRGGGLHPPSQTTYLVNSVNQYTSIDSFGPSHDANGNLLTGQVPGSAGLQPASFTWNIHNELVTATAANGDSAQYQYDALGRKVRSTTTISNIQSQISFLYNGWNVELEYENGAYARRMTWGLDLSQTLQGAGGVGGLIMTEELPSGGGAPIPHFPTYDGNGNITAWVNASGTVTARQRYDAFGNIIEQTGTPPSRYGYSTKPIELVTGFLYYGYRYYDPNTGRWPSRDPIGERGELNLYGFVFNRPLSWIDRLGWEPVDLTDAGSAFLNAFKVIGGDLLDRIAESYLEDEAANDQFDEALSTYVKPGGVVRYDYNQNDPWTQALMKAPLYDRMREFLVDMARESCKDGTMLMGHMGKWDNIADNGPAIQPVWDAYMYWLELELQSLGSNDGFFTITGVDCCKRVLTYEMLVMDSFRFGSNFRIPGTSVGAPDNPLGVTGAFGTVEITWQWAESLDF
jgi:RHS repeat-associated protein